MRPTIRWGFLCLLVIWPVQVHATTYYVDRAHQSASDANPGTEALPLRTVNEGASRLTVPGDTMIVKAGTYDVGGLGDWNTPAIQPPVSGTANARITMMVNPGDTVILQGSNAHIIGTAHRDYVTVDGFTIHGTIKVMGASDRVEGAIIQNNTLIGWQSPDCGNWEAMSVRQATNVLIRNNRISGFHSTPKGCDGVGVRMYNATDIVMENNYIFDVGDGLYDKVNGTRNIFRYNFIHDCARTGIRVRSGSGATHRDDQVYGNIVWRCGISVTGSSTNPNVNTKVYNNTVDAQGITVSAGTTNTQVWNNIFYQSSFSAPSGVTFCDYNLYYQGSGCGTNSVTGDPQFVNTAFKNPADWKLQASSPARGRGRNGEDIGAYSSNSTVVGITSTTAPPPGPSPVAPDAPSNLRITRIGWSGSDSPSTGGGSHENRRFLLRHDLRLQRQGCRHRLYGHWRERDRNLHRTLHER